MGKLTDQEVFDLLGDNVVQSLYTVKTTVDDLSSGLDPSLIEFTQEQKDAIDSGINSTILNDILSKELDLDGPDIIGILPVSKGGTGSTNAEDAKTALEAADLIHSHKMTDITSGVLPISNGGTGNTIGNSVTTGKLFIPVNINGESFDGSKDIIITDDTKAPIESVYTKDEVYNKSEVYPKPEVYTKAEIDTALGSLPSVPKDHATPDGRYGKSSDTLYGHAIASNIIPSAPGVPKIGESTWMFANADHVHPEQTDILGNATTSDSWKSPINISLVGDVSGKVNVDGSKDITGALTISNNGVIPGKYTQFDVSAKGLVTQGYNPTTLSQYGITDAEPLLTTGLNTQYIKGNKTLGEFETDVRGTKLTGLDVTTSSSVSAVDSVITSVGKLQSQIDNISTGVPAEHDHDDRYYTQTEINLKLQGHALVSHNHDGIYYTEAEIDQKLSQTAPISHASAINEYGIGSSTQYGHLKVYDSGTQSSGYGVAASPAYVNTKVSKSGDTMTGNLVTEYLTTYNVNGVRFLPGADSEAGIGVFFRNVGDVFYLLMTDPGSAKTGSYNSFRPMLVNLQTGRMDINGSSIDSAKLGGIPAGNFLRKDETSYATSKQAFIGITGTLPSISGGTSALEIGRSTSPEAYMSFHRMNFAVNLGLTAGSNDLRVGGWSMGNVSFPIMHEGRLNRTSTNTAYTTGQIRNIVLSTGAPSGGSNGDVWLRYV